jgi:carboxypeptidase PM20D1
LAGLGLAGVALGRTALYGSTASAVESAPQIAIPEGAAERLAGALRFPTISPEDPAAFDAEAFGSLHAFLATSFRKAHAQLERETIATHSLLYTWRGSDPSLKPILLMGHQDVVPIEPGTEGQWEHPPFAGRIADGYIWGRGAIDNKSAIVGLLEAIELLVGEGFRPARTIHLAFGHDEEVGGTRGAREIARLLERRDVQLEMVLDEGGVIGEGILPGISSPVALVGIAEKGFLSIELSTRVTGGHSSLPPKESAIGILSDAIARLEENQMPARFEGPTQLLFEKIGPALPLPQRAAFANLWLTHAAVLGQLEDSPTTNAMVRTTIAPTVFQAGAKDNVLPSQARAVINFRILPGDSSASVLEHVRTVVDDDRVEIEVVGRFSAEPSAVSRTDSESFRRLERTIRRVNPDAIVAPYLVVVVSDARYFSGLSANVFRFLPLRLDKEDLARMHGANERISVRDYVMAVRFYRQLIVDNAG